MGHIHLRSLLFSRNVGTGSRRTIGMLIGSESLIPETGFGSSALKVPRPG